MCTNMKKSKTVLPEYFPSKKTNPRICFEWVETYAFHITGKDKS